MSIDFRCGTSPDAIPSPFVLAPMAAFTSWPLRLLCQEQGAGCSITEMVGAGQLVSRSNPGHTSRLLARHADEQRTGVQLLGSDPSIMAEAARMVADRGFAFVDLNAACPARRIMHAGAGAALLENPGRIAALLTALAQAGLPVTIKLRSGTACSPAAARAAIKIAEDCGLAAVWLHARRVPRGWRPSTAPDYAAAAEAVAAARIPVFISGDIMTAERAVQVLRRTGAAGVMIARGALGNPFIFRQAAALLAGEPLPAISAAETLAAVQRHFDGLRELLGEQTASLNMRTLLSLYLRPYPFLAKLLPRAKQVSSGRDINSLLSEVKHLLLTSPPL
jgi:nifR3 family TIM-barrel protein